MALQTEIEGYEDKTLNRLIKVEQQRDELLEALKEISSPTQTEGLLWWQIKARAAIAKSEGK